MNLFSEYVEHGWKLCRIKSGDKGPRTEEWSHLKNAVTNPAYAIHLESAGLCHAYSGTAALDIDDWEAAEKWLNERGVSLEALREDPASVQILSGRSNRGKFLFSLDTPLPTKKLAKGALELRCGTLDSRTTQDVLPPSKHPGGTTYTWKGDWKNLSPMPAALLKIWHDNLSAVSDTPVALTGTGDLAALQLVLARRDPTCSYDDWIRIGMACHHETGGGFEGLDLWDKWSRGSGKYPGYDNLLSHWQSFGGSTTPVTLGSLQKLDVAAIEDFDIIVEREEIVTAPVAGPRFKFLSLNELFQRPKPDWIIEGVLPHAGVGALWGQPAGGKTFLAVDLALSVALGQPWRGTSIDGSLVLYIAAEDDTGVQLRLAAGLAARGAQDAPIRVLPAAPSLSSPEQAKALLESIVSCGRPSIIFVDTLAAVTPGTDENAAKDMSQLIHYCQILHKRTGALILLIHHEGKTIGKGPRGWSGLHGAFDVEWAVTDDGVTREMKISKMKNAASGSTYKFRLSPFGESCIVEWI